MQYDLPPTFGIYLTPMIASFFTRSPLSTFFRLRGTTRTPPAIDGDHPPQFIQKFGRFSRIRYP